MNFNEHFYTVTDEAITATGKVQTFTADSLEEAYSKALYTHRLHNGSAHQYRRLIICPSCGQTTIVKATDQEAPTRTVNGYEVDKDGEGYSARVKGCKTSDGDTYEGSYYAEAGTLYFHVIDANGNPYETTEEPIERIDLTKGFSYMVNAQEFQGPTPRQYSMF